MYVLMCINTYISMLHASSVVSNSATPWTVAHQVPLAMGFPRSGILEWVATSYSRGSS